MVGEKEEEPEFFGSTTVGAKGQVVIPADLRKKLNLESGDKLIFFKTPARPRGFSAVKPENVADEKEFEKSEKSSAKG